MVILARSAQRRGIRTCVCVCGATTRLSIVFACVLRSLVSSIVTAASILDTGSETCIREG